MKIQLVQILHKLPIMEKINKYQIAVDQSMTDYNAI